MMKKERFEAFTDAVIAIILTILVLEIRLPDNDHSWSALTETAPHYQQQPPGLDPTLTLAYLPCSTSSTLFVLTLLRQF
ncbi:TMEM175 family protein [Levilactobacillus fujinensis]|uniref:TMEM175 family protein n=1 Tax=Levilactobacillus fujinensis TaxID=2486024 RepID=A0ABW1TG72_9LACO|nr:TMEM175 family protein [Levilactobacillus fujinensis]